MWWYTNLLGCFALIKMPRKGSDWGLCNTGLKIWTLDLHSNKLMPIYHLISCIVFQKSVIMCTLGCLYWNQAVCLFLWKHFWLTVLLKCRYLRKRSNSTLLVLLVLQLEILGKLETCISPPYLSNYLPFPLLNYCCRNDKKKWQNCSEKDCKWIDSFFGAVLKTWR